MQLADGVGPMLVWGVHVRRRQHDPELAVQAGNGHRRL
jgi:hypothetical protein